jgi:hypothetical protein
MRRPTREERVGRPARSVDIQDGVEVIKVEAPFLTGPSHPESTLKQCHEYLFPADRVPVIVQ